MDFSLLSQELVSLCRAFSVSLRDLDGENSVASIPCTRVSAASSSSDQEDSSFECVRHRLIHERARVGKYKKTTIGRAICDRRSQQRIDKL